MQDASRKGRLKAPEMFTLNEAAELLGLAPSTLRHQTRNGKFDAFKMGREWFVTGAEVQRYRREHLRKDGAA